MLSHKYSTLLQQLLPILHLYFAITQLSVVTHYFPTTNLNFACVSLNVLLVDEVSVCRRLLQPGFVWMMKNLIYVRDTTLELDSVK